MSFFVVVERMASDKCHSDHTHNCEHASKFGCEQTLDEIKFENSILNACVYGDFDRVKDLVKRKGISIINEQDKNGYSCLHYAARNGHIEICKYLIEQGANVNLKTLSCFSTPLHRAAYVGNAQIVKLLVANKSNPFDQDCDGKTPLHKCVEEFLRSNRQAKYAETMKVLVAFNSDLIYVKDKLDKTPYDLYPEIIKLT